MNVNFNGAGENVLTFIAADSVTEAGTLVKISANGTVAKCAAGDAFCGVTLAVRNGYAAVQMSGYAALPATEQIDVGYQTLAATASGAAEVSENGRELLVIDSTATQVGVIL